MRNPQIQTSRPLTLRRNFSWSFIGNTIYAASQWGMLMVMAKLGTPEIVGQFTLGLAITAPIILLTNLQLRNVQATDAKRNYMFHHYLSLRLFTVTLALLLMVVVTYFTGFHGETALVILIIGLAKIFESISDVYYGLFQQHERLDLVAKSLIVRGLLSLGIFITTLHFTGSILWGVISLACSWALVLFILDSYHGTLIVTSFANNSSMTAGTVVTTASRKRSPIKNLVLLTLPLGFAAMIVSLIANIPRYFVEHYLNSGELGIFAALAYLMVAGNTVVGALAQSATPRLARFYADDKVREFVKLLTKLVAFGALIGGGGVLLALLFGKEFLSFIYRAEYAQRMDVFIWLMVAAGIGYMATFLNFGITAMRRFNVQIPLYGTVAGMTAVACLWLVPRYGLLGAALGLVAAMVLQSMLSVFVIMYALGKVNTPEHERVL